MSFDVVLGSVLIVITNLWLKSFIPPLKPQYHAFILLSISAIIAYFMFSNFTYGIAVGGLVYFKDALLEEVRYVLDVLRPKSNGLENIDKEK